MADVKTDQEPSIEEILESIRQIISEDETATPDNTPPLDLSPPPAPPAEPEKTLSYAQESVDESVLDLTEKVQLDSPMDLDLHHNPIPKKSSASRQSDDSLLSDVTADAAASAMAQLLSGNMAVEREVAGRVGNVTLEDIARDVMKPLLKTWLDQNLPSIIERMVKKEIEKISHRALGD